MLLGAVVQVALDAAALGVGGGDQAATRGLQVGVRAPQVGQRGLQGLVEAAVAQHDRQPAGDLGQRPVVGRAERSGVRRPFDEHQRQDAAAVHGGREPQLPVGQRTASRGRRAGGAPTAAASPARPRRTRRSRPSSAGVERGRHGSASGSSALRHDERAVQAGSASAAGAGRRRSSRPGPDLDAGRAASRGASTRRGVRSRSSTGLPRPAFSAKSASSSSGDRRRRVQRGAHPARGAAGERAGSTPPRRRSPPTAGPIDPASAPAGSRPSSSSNATSPSTTAPQTAA